MHLKVNWWTSVTWEVLQSFFLARLLTIRPYFHICSFDLCSRTFKEVWSYSVTFKAGVFCSPAFKPDRGHDWIYDFRAGTVHVYWLDLDRYTAYLLCGARKGSLTWLLFIPTIPLRISPNCICFLCVSPWAPSQHFTRDTCTRILPF